MKGMVVVGGLIREVIKEVIREVDWFFSAYRQ